MHENAPVEINVFFRHTIWERFRSMSKNRFNNLENNSGACGPSPPFRQAPIHEYFDREKAPLNKECFPTQRNL